MTTPSTTFSADASFGGDQAEAIAASEARLAAVAGERADRDRGGGDSRIGHLRGKGALPDEVVERELITAQFALNLAWGAEGVA